METKKAALTPAERVILLLADLLAPTGDPAVAKRSLLNAVATLIDADAWIWTLTRLPAASPGDPPAIVLLLDGGLNAEQHAVLLGIQRSPHRRVMADAILPAVFATGGVTVRRADLFSDETWPADPYNVACVAPLGMADLMLAVRRVGGADVSTVAFYRAKGRPGFDAAALATLGLIADHVGWLHHVGDMTAAADVVVDLTPRERQVLQCLIAGQPRKQIAATLGIKPYTVSDYQKTIYRRFGVNSRSALQAKFLRGHTGPTPQPEGPNEVDG